MRCQVTHRVTVVYLSRNSSWYIFLTPCPLTWIFICIFEPWAPLGRARHRFPPRWLYVYSLTETGTVLLETGWGLSCQTEGVWWWRGLRAFLAQILQTAHVVFLHCLITTSIHKTRTKKTSPVIVLVLYCPVLKNSFIQHMTLFNLNS